MLHRKESPKRSAARLRERTEAKQLTVNGVNLEPLEKTIENGRAILRIQTDQTVKAILSAIAKSKGQ